MMKIMTACNEQVEEVRMRRKKERKKRKKERRKEG
jgi:hypothetical protein